MEQLLKRKETIQSIEKALSNEIVLYPFPLIKLVPCFECDGEYIIPKKITFRGMGGSPSSKDMGG